MDRSNPLLRGLGSERVAELSAQAKRLGISPQRLVRDLIETGLQLEREARQRSFDDILAPLRETPAGLKRGELDQLVDRARNRHHRSGKKGR